MAVAMELDNKKLHLHLTSNLFDIWSKQCILQRENKILSGIVYKNYFLKCLDTGQVDNLRNLTMSLSRNILHYRESTTAGQLIPDTDHLDIRCSFLALQ